MGILGKLIALAILTAITAIVLQLFIKSDKLDLLQTEPKWFGKNKLKSGEPLPKDPDTINKFTVNISDEVHSELKQRLRSTRFVKPLPDSQFNYGFNGDYLKQVVDYWLTKFDWRKQEKELNKYNHFKTKISGIDIHFIHVKPSKPAKTIVPLMLIHGWPGSIWEFYKTIPLLTEPTADGLAFEIICPSIPGYGFSEAPNQSGLDSIQTAHIFIKLMKKLNHNNFVVNGGDWGSFVARSMAKLYPQNIRGLHLNLNRCLIPKGIHFVKFLIAMWFPQLVFENPDRDYPRIFPLKKRFQLLMRETGYYHIQATKPDTISSALADSPAGLAAYILEKSSIAVSLQNVDKWDGGLTDKISLDEWLTGIMIYWVSDNMAATFRFYKENVESIYGYNWDEEPIDATVPVGVANFPNEIGHCPKELVGYKILNLVHFTEQPRGGHFAAFEEPKLFADDIKLFAKNVLDIEKQSTKQQK
ncbi:epoxide hydrolase 1-like [Oppia nitens]|uniref:epoxide hydrolase 1-like n=1 Tax=Oppia nitens TaxID=1686743 RepID=UPI0023DA9F6C|nr:epoxide hydrolase 1-like [Oppia nitens]